MSKGLFLCNNLGLDCLDCSYNGLFVIMSLHGISTKTIDFCMLMSADRAHDSCRPLWSDKELAESVAIISTLPYIAVYCYSTDCSRDR